MSSNAAPHVDSDPVRSYYEILGVARDADEEQIHSAYRKLARKLHPDLNPGVDTHAELAVISEAYTALSRTERRTAYDATLGATLDATLDAGSRQSTDPAPGRAGGPGDDTGAAVAQPAPEVTSGPVSGLVSQEGTDLFAQLVVSPQEAASGGETWLNLQFAQPCGACDASGYDLSLNPRPCPWCDGLRMHPATGEPCANCGAQGQISNTVCPTCVGRRSAPVLTQIPVTVPAGAATGRRIRLSRKGAVAADGRRRGHLYVDLIVEGAPTQPAGPPVGSPSTATDGSAEPQGQVGDHLAAHEPGLRGGHHPSEVLVAPNGEDVGVVAHLTYPELRTGATVRVGGLHGAVHTVTIPPASTPGTVVLVPGGGHRRTDGHPADLHVQVALDLPQGPPSPQETAALAALTRATTPPS